MKLTDISYVNECRNGTQIGSLAALYNFIIAKRNGYIIHLQAWGFGVVDGNLKAMVYIDYTLLVDLLYYMSYFKSI